MDYEVMPEMERSAEETYKDRIATLRTERDDWHKDRDLVLENQIPWMKMIEAAYPGNEYDFGDALKKLIDERDVLERKAARLTGQLNLAEQATENYLELYQKEEKKAEELQQYAYQQKGDWVLRARSLHDALRALKVRTDRDQESIERYARRDTSMSSRLAIVKEIAESVILDSHSEVIDKICKIRTTLADTKFVCPGCESQKKSSVGTAHKEYVECLEAYKATTAECKERDEYKSRLAAVKEWGSRSTVIDALIMGHNDCGGLVNELYTFFSPDFTCPDDEDTEENPYVYYTLYQIEKDKNTEKDKRLAAVKKAGETSPYYIDLYSGPMGRVKRTVQVVLLSELDTALADTDKEDE